MDQGLSEQHNDQRTIIMAAPWARRTEHCGCPLGRSKNDDCGCPPGRSGNDDCGCPLGRSGNDDCGCPLRRSGDGDCGCPLRRSGNDDCGCLLIVAVPWERRTEECGRPLGKKSGGLWLSPGKEERRTVAVPWEGGGPTPSPGTPHESPCSHIAG